MLKKYKYVSQIDMRDCGVAALSSIIQHYNSYYSLASLRELAKTTKEGTTALGIIKAAEHIGFDAYAIETDMTIFDMENIPYPFIAHVNKNNKLPHYYVIYHSKKNSIIIGDPDPTVKITKMSKEKFSEEWSGTLLLIAPGNKYKPYKEKKKGILSFIPTILQHKKLINYTLLISLIITGINLLGTYYLQEILDNYIPKHRLSQLEIVSIGLIIVYIVQQILYLINELILTKLSQKLISTLFLKYMLHILDLPISFFATRRAGEIISRFTDSTTIIEALASTIFTLFIDIIIILIVSGFMLIQSPSLFLVTLLEIPCYIIIIFSFIQIFEKLNNKVMLSNSLVNSAIIEDINGIETIKSLSSEHARYSKIRKEFQKYLHYTFNLEKYEIIQFSLKKGTQLILNVTILWFGSKLVISNNLSIGELITYNALLFYFTTPLENIINLQTKLQSANVANNRLNEVYLVKSEHHITNNTLSKQLHGDILLKNISFKYGFGTNTLTNINLQIKSGEKISFIGTSGSGKTTLAKLLVSFFSPNTGNIFIGDTDISKINKKILRHHIGYLPQQAYIFDGSILENLTLGNEIVEHKDIIKACQIAEIMEDIKNMPQGFYTQLSDGSGLSGGQKQRLALARILLADPPILILDEATSGLDIFTEKKVIDNLMTLNKTIIFISHNLTIAQKSDMIVVLEKGQIKELGNHKELLLKKGIYYQLLSF